MFRSAIEKKKKGYEPIEDKKTTEFWQKYYEYVETHYPQIDIYKVNGPRGGKSGWPYMRTGDKRVYIMHKSDKGYVDLTFSGLGEYVNPFNMYMNKLLLDGMYIRRTQKSMSIRMKVPVIDFHQEFEKYTKEMEEIIKTVLILLDFFHTIDVDDLYNKIINKK